MVMAGTKVGSLSEILSSRSRATFSHRVNFDTVGFMTLNKMKQWCEDNCNGLWRAQSSYALYWQFEDDQDALMFMLKWATADGNKLK